MKFSRKEYWSCHFLFQGIFLTQGSNLCLLHLLQWQATWEDQGSLEGYACMHAKSPQPCLTLCDIMPTHLPPPSLLFQARIMEWAVISSSSGSSQPGDQTRISYACCVSRYHLLTGIFLYIEKVLSA